MKKTIIGIAMILLMINCSFAITVMDTFTGYTDGNITGQGSASGDWTSGWGTNVTFRSYVVDSGTVGSVSTGVSQVARSYRSFTDVSVTSGSPDIWLSYDVNYHFDASSTNAYGLVGLWYYNNDKPGNFGVASGRTDWSNYVLATSPYYDYSNVAIIGDSWNTVWIKITPTGDGVGTYTMWVNPDTTVDPSDPSQDQYIVFQDSAFDLGDVSGTKITTINRLVLSFNGYTSERSIDLDNIRISTDSSPVVPEPATIALLAIGTVSFVAKRKR